MFLINGIIPVKELLARIPDTFFYDGLQQVYVVCIYIPVVLYTATFIKLFYKFAQNRLLSLHSSSWNFYSLFIYLFFIFTFQPVVLNLNYLLTAYFIPVYKIRIKNWTWPLQVWCWNVPVSSCSASSANSHICWPTGCTIWREFSTLTRKSCKWCPFSGNSLAQFFTFNNLCWCCCWVGTFVRECAMTLHW